MARRRMVKEGQSYAQQSGVTFRPSIWKVGTILADSLLIPHARLINVSDPLQIKTISCSTLANRSYYELIAETQAAAG